MKSISARVDDKTAEEIDELVEDRGSTTSATARDLIEKGLAYDETIAELEAEIAERDEEIKDLSTEIQRVHNEKRQLIQQRAETTEIVRYVEEQKEQEENPSRLDRAVQLLRGE